MAAGCKIPSAMNFNPDANPDNYSCVYLLKNQGACHWFADVPPIQENNKSFTMSYAIAGGAWVFFHDYFPDMYIHTRNKLYSAKNSEIFRHNNGPAGQYYTSTKKSFFIDVVFQSEFNLILETVNWATEYLSQDTDQPFQTLTHISIWNATQHTGRVPLSKIQEFKDFTARNTLGTWSFNDFRNILVNKGVRFLQNIFYDYALIGAQTDPNLPYYQKELMNDKWFCVRFEFDNQADANIQLHDTTIQAIKSDR